MGSMEKLINRITEIGNPLCVELDGANIPNPYLKDCPMERPWETPRGITNIMLKFNKAVIDIISNYVAVVSIPIFNYLKFGSDGISVYIQTLMYAKSYDMIVISDINVGDVAHRMEEYSSMVIGKRSIGGFEFTAEYDSDFITFNPSVGYLEIEPILDDIKRYNRGAFATVTMPKNDESMFYDWRDVNGMRICGGDREMRPFYMEMIRMVSIGNIKFGLDGRYYPVGVLINMMNQDIERKRIIIHQIRKENPSLFLFLMCHSCVDLFSIISPAVPAFREDKTGAIIGISTRKLLTAMYTDYPGMAWDQSIKQVMKDGIEITKKIL